MVVSNLLLLKKNYMVVTDNLVGMDHHVENMGGLLNVDSDDVSIVGIHGMGGIGKTTIAKVIYNQLLERFECCCFLIDVRETSLQNKGLVELQTRLVSKILKGKCADIVDVDDGINIIKNTVCRKKVLIVLDDVDKKSQFDKLAGKRDWFGSGSRIIVTTRNKKVLDQLEVDKTYEPPMMEPGHSLELFSRHAFRRDFPPKDYDIHSNKIVSTAAGLPLALEVFGSLLLGKRKHEWEDFLAKLKEIPNNEVLNKLMISYEALEHGEKQIFLDIACLFIGRDKKYPWYMWDACKFYPGEGINDLVLRSLVKIQDDGKFMMHDQLRDLGREIVRRENCNDPGERSRLWLPEEALDILERRMGTEKVEVLCLDLEEASDNHNFTSEEFQQLPNLRFLQVDYADLTGDFKNLLSNLRWLHWHGCPGNFKLTNFHLKNLVILDLSYSNITYDWEAWNQLKVAKKLKVLDLSHCKCLIRNPNFSTFATLERLILEGCENLVQIDQSFVYLRNLRVLNMKNCGIKSVPSRIKSLLPRLKVLN
ncbi:hypothetical protein L1049_020201 [Liquidambar formosana]|uniref:AAA+ ATPase domain-containing protein n=1 Tax=Liquidambar formosana TaxID=63359 RepID=A0AAP0X774_LIQFO